VFKKLRVLTGGFKVKLSKCGDGLDSDVTDFRGRGRSLFAIARKLKTPAPIYVFLWLLLVGL
jgi:hypothetical protein